MTDAFETHHDESSARGSGDPAEDLLAECLSLPEGDWEAAIERTCATHPEHAAVLRRRLRMLQDEGLGLTGRAGSTAAGEPLPERLGDYRLLERLGSGGMGVVYLARQESLGREVALKVIRPEHLYFPGARQRFRREVETLARFHHPGIVAVYAVGEEAGVPYFAMERVRGFSLGEALATFAGRPPGRLTGDDLAALLRARLGGDYAVKDPARTFGGSWLEVCFRLTLQAAQALEHAHAHGVLHRDLKPSNLMLTADGRVQLVDFGLSVAEGGGRITRSGAEVGSLPYMAPEQLRGGTIDARTDVYALGVTLYEMLTLCCPYLHESAEETRRDILEGAPRPPRELNPALPWDAETVCLTAMDPDPARRYATAAAFAADLMHVLALEPIEARRPGPWLRLRRWVQRHPTASTAAALGVLLVVGAPLLLALQQRRANVRLAEANQQLATSNQQLAAANADLERLSDDIVLQELTAEEQELWPALPERAAAMERWLARADDLAARLPVHEASLSRLRERALPHTPEQIAADEARRREVQAGLEELAQLRAVLRANPNYTPDERERLQEQLAARERSLRDSPVGRPTWRFEATADAWQHQRLVALLEGLRHLMPRIADVRRRLEAARTIVARSIDAHREAWARAIAEVAAEPRYAGLALRPQRGLVPLGPDPRSRLQEFAFLPTGDVPARDPRHGRLLLTADSGIVFVLIPGGTFGMGAQPPDDTHRPGEPNVDPAALSAEYPVQQVDVAPFFLAKHEFTQAQWQRFTGDNPSPTKPGPTAFEEVTWMHPVHGVSWDQADRVLKRLWLQLPSEAQWEYACRAGTTTPWWTGSDKATLRGAANLRDAKVRTAFPPDTKLEFEDSLYDGWVGLAPIGTFRANAFGLHDVHGNVAEWCQNAFEVYGLPDGAVGQLGRLEGSQHRVCRGGSCYTLASDLRSSHRVSLPPENRDPQLGVRPARAIE